MRALVLGALGVLTSAAAGCGGSGSSSSCARELTFFFQPEFDPSEGIWDVVAAHVPLETVCPIDPNVSACPANPDEARAIVSRWTGNSPRAGTIVRGCGVVAVEYRDALGSLWTYDETTGALIGAARSTDYSLSPCAGGGVFQAGQGPPLSDADIDMSVTGRPVGHRPVCADIVVERFP